MKERHKGKVRLRRTDILKEWSELGKKDAKRDISEEYLVNPPAAPTPSPPLQPCCMLAGVFLYKRPILWDARMAMEVFDGHYTKAKRQALIPVSVPLLPRWLYNTVSGVALLIPSAHIDSKVENPHPWGRNSHTFAQWIHAYKQYKLTHTVHAYARIYCIHVHMYTYSYILKRMRAHMHTNRHTNLPCMFLADKSSMIQSNLWTTFSDINTVYWRNFNMRHCQWQWGPIELAVLLLFFFQLWLHILSFFIMY